MPIDLNQTLGQIDIALFALVGLSGLLGLWRGIVKEVMSIATLLAAIITVRLYGQIAGLQLEAFIDNGALRVGLASAVLFVSVMLLGGWLTRLLQRLLTFTGLRLIDRVAGGAFGLARGVLIILVAIYFAEPFVSSRPFWLESVGIHKAQEALRWGAQWLEPVTPESDGQRII